MKQCVTSNDSIGIFIGAGFLVYALAAGLGFFVWKNSVNYSKKHPGQDISTTRLWWYFVAPLIPTAAYFGSDCLIWGSRLESVFSAGQSTFSCTPGLAQKVMLSLGLALWPLSIYLLVHSFTSILKGKIKAGFSIFLSALSLCMMCYCSLRDDDHLDIYLGLYLSIIADSIVSLIEFLRSKAEVRRFRRHVHVDMSRPLA